MGLGLKTKTFTAGFGYFCAKYFYKKPVYMKKLLITLVFAFAGTALAVGQGIEFFQGSWTEAKAKAKAEGKLIFADAFASWCGPCKRMAAQTFPDPQVGALFNANFVCVKYDMEKPENAEFAEAFPVRSYPTLLFIDGDGKLVRKEVGARSPDGLIELGRQVLGNLDNLPDLEEQYAGGKRDPEFMYNYVKALNRAGKPSLKYTNEYLATQKDLNTPFNLRFILEGVQEADSRVYNLMIEHRKAIAELEGDEAVNKKIVLACNRTAAKAVEFRDPALLEEAKNKLAAGYPDKEKAADFAFFADGKYYTATNDPKAYLKSAQVYQKSVVKDDPDGLNNLVIKMMQSFPSDDNVLKQAEKWAKSAAQESKKAEHYMTLAQVYKNKGDKDAALEVALQAKKAVPEDDPNGKAKIDNFIRLLDLN